MWLLFKSQWVRKKLGGKWGQVSGFFWGKRWVRLHQDAVMWDESWP
jgi:hypothetical protein